jgi:hypothetical protein
VLGQVQPVHCLLGSCINWFADLLLIFPGARVVVCCRVLRRLTLEDAAAASHTFVTLMGDKVAPRRALIEAEGQRFTLEQLDI